MDLKKYLVPVGIFLVVLVAFFVVKSIFFKDAVKPDLAKLINANSQMTTLSTEAQANLGNFDLQVAASNTAAVITSDNIIITKYYRDNYGKKIPGNKSNDPLKKLQESPSGAAYDEAYRRLIVELKNRNIELARTLSTTSKSDKLDSLLQSYIEHLTTLFEKFN